jgi:hypothetical protein
MQVYRDATPAETACSLEYLSTRSLPLRQFDMCSKCPLLFLTNLVYSAPAMNTAVALSKTGYLNCAGRAKTMVEAYEHSSNKF